VNDALETPATEFTVAFTGPLVAPLGTAATIWLLLQLVTEDAATPLKVTVLLPWVAPKFDPEIVTDEPIPPSTGETPVTNGLVPIVTDTLSKVAVARLRIELL
jgi:hypothetical protein